MIKLDSKIDNETEAQSVATTNAEYKPIHRIVFTAMFILCTACYSAYTLLLHLSPKDTVTGEFLWHSGSMVTVTEVAKLVLSLIFLAVQIAMSSVTHEPDSIEKQQRKKWCPSRLQDLLPYSVPALLYAINNNLGALLQLEMDAVSYQILSNMKILTTAVLFRIIMRQELSKLQWLSLLLLFLAGVSNGAGGLLEKSRSSARLHVTPIGLFMMLVYCSISGLASVYTEYVMKRQVAISVNAQNSLLYAYGIAINLIIYAYQASITNSSGADSFLLGFDWTTWALVLCQALGGISMGMLMKFGSNITKLFVVSCSMLVIAVFAVLVFNFKVTIYCVTAFAGVLLSQFLYHYKSYANCFNNFFNS